MAQRPLSTLVHPSKQVRANVVTTIKLPMAKRSMSALIQCNPNLNSTLMSQLIPVAFWLLRCRSSNILCNENIVYRFYSFLVKIYNTFKHFLELKRIARIFLCLCKFLSNNRTVGSDHCPGHWLQWLGLPPCFFSFFPFFPSPSRSLKNGTCPNSLSLHLLQTHTVCFFLTAAD